MTGTSPPASLPRRERVRWVPRQHGAWAMLAVPVLLGVVASRPSPWQLLLAVTATSAYLASAAAIDWARARHRAYAPPAVVFGAVAGGSGLVLVAHRPELLAIAAVVAAGGAIAIGASIAGRPRSLAASLALAGQATALVPAAALVADAFDAGTVARATLVAGAYLVGSVLLVRSVIRERGRAGLLLASVGFHVAAALVQAWLVPWPYAVVALGLAVRAAALPALRARLAAGPRPLRPIHVGLVEIAASMVLVLVSVVVGF